MDINLRVSDIVPSLFADSESARKGAKNLLWLLDALAQMNLAVLQDKHFEPLYQSGTRYRFDFEPTTQVWLGMSDIYRGSPRLANCKELAPARIAELRNNGQRAYPRLSWQMLDDGKLLYHVTLLRTPPSLGEYIPGHAINPKILYPAPLDECQALGGGAWYVECPSRVLGMDGPYYPEETTP